MEFIIILLLVIGVLIYLYFSHTKDYKNKVEKQNEEEWQVERLLHIKYDQTKKQINIPNNAKLVNSLQKITINGKTYISSGQYFIWLDNNCINYFPDRRLRWDADDFEEIVSLKQLKLDNINYFCLRGEFFRENKISGGSGGGSSIGGAAIGGVVAGGAGAIIGSRNKIEPIKSKLITHDTRELIIEYNYNNKVKLLLVFSNKDFEVLNELIPEKEKSIIDSLKKNKLLEALKIDEKHNSTDLSKQIRELADLKNEGILTEEEFNEKKKILLDKII